jgi:hypothetical protein
MSQAGFPTPRASNKKFNRRLVAPIFSEISASAFAVGGHGAIMECYAEKHCQSTF